MSTFRASDLDMYCRRKNHFGIMGYLGPKWVGLSSAYNVRVLGDLLNQVSYFNVYGKFSYESK